VRFFTGQSDGRFRTHSRWAPSGTDMAARSECVDRAPCLAELYGPHACRLAFLSVPSSARPSCRLHFEARLLNIIPPNGAHVFLVRRVDGTDAWVRPQHRAVGFGRLENWFPPRPLPRRGACRRTGSSQLQCWRIRVPTSAGPQSLHFYASSGITCGSHLLAVKPRPRARPHVHKPPCNFLG